MSVAAINAKRDAAITAMEAGDYAAAIRYALAAKMLIATTPNITRSAGGGSQGFTWSPAAIDQFITECKQQQTNAAVTATGGIRRSNVVYERPETVGDYA